MRIKPNTLCPKMQLRGGGRNLWGDECEGSNPPLPRIVRFTRVTISSSFASAV